MGAIGKLLVEASFSRTRLILAAMGAHLGEGSYIENHLFIHNARTDYSNLTIGQNAYVGKDCFFDLSDKISIGNNTTIGMRVTILTHFDGGKSVINQHYPKVSKPTSVGSGAYVGAGAILLAGITVGDGAVVGAGSVVDKDLTPRAIFGGVPAKLIRFL